MSSVQTSPEYASRAARLDRILAELLKQTPGVEAAAVVSFDGLPMASALPVGMDEDRVAAMSAALLSLAERASQDLNRGLLSQVYIEGEHGSVFLVSAKDEAVLIAVTASGAKVGMMLYEVKLAASKVGEALQGPVPLPTPLPSNLTRGFSTPTAERHVNDAPVAVLASVESVEAAPTVDEVEDLAPEDQALEDLAVEDVVIDDIAVEDVVIEEASPVAAEPAAAEPVAAEPVAAEPVAEHVEPEAVEPAPVADYVEYAAADYATSDDAAVEYAAAEYAAAEYAAADDDTDYADSPLGSPLYDQVAFGHPERPDYFVAAPAAAQTWYADQPWPVDETATAEPEAAVADNGWSSYAPSATVLPGEPTAWN
jgi:predicted regulator of Ras-like GTPase activity (Roadblock/LC7/MglB family)